MADAEGKLGIPDNMIRVSSKFAAINKLILRDLNNPTQSSFFTRYTKDDISKYLENPSRYENQLREAVVYLYSASSHFRRLIQYFVGLSDFAYIVEPYRLDPKKANVKTVNNNYRKALSMLSSINVKTQLPKILTVCLREDVFFGTLWVTADSVTIQQIPSEYCRISSIEGNVFNVSFDFSFFDSRKALLEYYPAEFQRKYKTYQANPGQRWIELDSPTSFAVKCNSDIPDYAVPPFAGVLREVFELEDYRSLKLTKTALENYAMIAMKLPYNKDDGSWILDYEKAREFWRNLDSVLPEEIGSVLTPMEMDKISFERAHSGDENTIAAAEEALFTAAGVSSLLFNNDKA